ncbi:ribokinase [Agrococcus sp. SGAir0287]|uniref:ribokinase n=1 Tax=Agrococcus sp. SGAir0287 TaxID=2070347 RepID=UPI0010CCBAEE|nr:ribokinase [Agrococcus sp. SGAir0287]QCR20786.1 ribokinase [Agrococcus sp. SGAir0287]
MSVIVVGSINVDVTVVADRMAQAGETITGTALETGLGGKGANQAVAAARAGAPTAMVGCVGSDAFADVALGGLRDSDVDTDAVRVVDGGTGIAHIRVAGGDNSIVVVPLANARLAVAQAREALAATEASVLLLQLEVEQEVVVAAAEAAHARGIRVVLDPAPAAPLPESIWRHVSLVKPNEHEAALLTGVEVTDAASAERAAQWFLERGVEAAIVTLGKAGAVLVDGAGARTLAGHVVDAVDSTAAGDTFSGFLAAALADGASLDDAARRAMAAAAISVTRVGATASIPSGAEVDAFLAGA